MKTPDPIAGNDRYRAPLARVEDGARPARGPRPLIIWIAVLLLLATAALEFVPLVRSGPGNLPPRVVLPALVAFGVLMLGDLVLIAMIFRGAGWARLAYLFIYAFTLTTTFSGTVSVMEVSKVVAQTIAMILLFSPPARGWFSRLDS